ncbi:MAG: hypothetical protein OXE05_12580 [Chloroflexi bacterium]|nr:hypothetical protein [Chloroflexota bacterium]
MLKRLGGLIFGLLLALLTASTVSIVLLSVAAVMLLSACAVEPQPMPATTPRPTPTPVPIADPGTIWVKPPEHMAYIWWEWSEVRDDQGNRFDEFEELVIDFTVHSDVEPLGSGNGLYLILAWGTISDLSFYFGLQTDVHADEPPYWRGKGVIFSRWETRDLANARYPEDGWTQSAGHEGDFIGVRRLYPWGTGDYRVRMAPDETAPNDSDGVWFGLWITNMTSAETTWIGSLKFPLQDGKAVIQTWVYSAMEIYGPEIRSIDIPAWHVSMKRPVGDGGRASWGTTGYSSFESGLLNSEIHYDAANDVVHIQAGGTTVRRTVPGTLEFR